MGQAGEEGQLSLPRAVHRAGEGTGAGLAVGRQRLQPRVVGPRARSGAGKEQLEQLQGPGSPGPVPGHGTESSTMREGTEGGTRCQAEKQAGPPLRGPPATSPPTVHLLHVHGRQQHRAHPAGDGELPGHIAASPPSPASAGARSGHRQTPRRERCSGRGAHGTGVSTTARPLLPPLLGRTPRSQDGRQSPGEIQGSESQPRMAEKCRARGGEGARDTTTRHRIGAEVAQSSGRAACHSPAGQGGRACARRRHPGARPALAQAWEAATQAGPPLQLGTPCARPRCGRHGAEPSSRKTGLPRSFPQPRTRELQGRTRGRAHATTALTPAESREKREQGKEATLRNTASRIPSQFFRPFWHQNVS